MCFVAKLQAAIVRKGTFIVPNVSRQSDLLGNTPPDWIDGIFEIAGGQFLYEDIPYSYVTYYQGEISIAPFNCKYAMSFNFSGCLMASFKLSGREYVCHIASDDFGKRKNNFCNFLKSNHISAGDFTIFKPKLKIKKNSKIGKVHALISKEGKCYSIGCSIFGEILEVKESTPLTMDQKNRLLAGFFDLENYQFPMNEDPGCCRI